MSRGQPIKTLQRIALLLDILKEAKQIHIRGIARILKVNPYTASKLVENYLKPFIDVKYMDQFGIRAKIISLKPGRENLTMEEVLRYRRLKRQLQESKA
jgi:hypothetical protein